jgi:hypothetical protein
MERRKVHSSSASKAYSAVAKARRNGTLADPKTLLCVDCGKAARSYDHRFYSRPLDVVPVCQKCNIKRGPSLDYAIHAIVDRLKKGNKVS